MVTGKNLLACVLISIIMVFSGGGDLTAADPNVRKDIKVEEVPDAGLLNASKTLIKNPHGYLQYDGTGYRVVTRETKPEKASQVRLKPLMTRENGTVYVLEVIDEKERPADEPKTADQGPRLAVERVEDMEKRKGVAPEPKKEHKADIGLGVKTSESSELLLGREVVVERRNDRGGLESRDDGWRFKFKTNF